nr:immunoglobulin heavy chain junction region [Macaca mulatta]MOV35627.1 immunoglobulin heavy chain junction region [Macaca mulatta]MOV35629.1 immunoglobulin heavy chain junction region [Macaca mulatta]MOV35644.1 immunoglobulin heavy chain junction region [Macaca mulatta]MOV35671.1 immunoglobulin heavy chain junction region [Macaca mulatta]
CTRGGGGYSFGSGARFFDDW